MTGDPISEWLARIDAERELPPERWPAVIATCGTIVGDGHPFAERLAVCYLKSVHRESARRIGGNGHARAER